MALKPETFQKCFQNWIADAIRTDDSGLKRQIAVDGKTCRRSHDASKELGALHIVSAWASRRSRPGKSRESEGGVGQAQSTGRSW